MPVASSIIEVPSDVPVILYAAIWIESPLWALLVFTDSTSLLSIIIAMIVRSV